MDMSIYLPYIIVITLLLAVICKCLWCKDITLNCFDKSATMPLRAILMLLVIIHHLRFNGQVALGLGASAVSIFFFMSGYGMVKQWKTKIVQGETGGGVFGMCN